MSNSASEKLLQELHALTAKVLKNALNDEPTAAMLGQAIKFLKDNGIEPARDADNTALQALADQIGQIAVSGDPAAIKDFLN
jgi:hypothetical protein